MLLTYFTGSCIHGNTTAETIQEVIFSISRITVLNIFEKDFEPFSRLCVQHTWSNLYTCMYEMIYRRRLSLWVQLRQIAVKILIEIST